MITAFNRIGWLSKKGSHDKAQHLVVRLSECDEIGFGSSSTRQGRRVSATIADTTIELFHKIPRYAQNGFEHFEEIQFFIDGIPKTE